MSYPWADPSAPTALDGPLGSIADALEKATDEYVSACNANAAAENSYLLAFHREWVQADHIAVTARAKHCDSQKDTTEAKCDWNIAQAREKACRAKCEELRNRLMAAQSHARLIGAQT